MKPPTAKGHEARITQKYGVLDFRRFRVKEFRDSETLMLQTKIATSTVVACVDDRVSFWALPIVVLQDPIRGFTGRFFRTMRLESIRIRFPDEFVHCSLFLWSTVLATSFSVRVPNGHSQDFKITHTPKK